MTTGWVVYACLILGLSSALVAGVFQAFSDFVMRGLVLAETAGGIDSMQHINETVLRSLFLVGFLALVPATLALAVYAHLELGGSGRTLIVAAAVLYLVTVFTVTVAGNVPMNRRLAAMAHSSAEAEAYWSFYSRVWTWCNHVRWIGSAGTAACLLLAAVYLASA